MSATRWNKMNLNTWLEPDLGDEDPSQLPDWGVEQILPETPLDEVDVTASQAIGEPAVQLHLPDILPILPLRGSGGLSRNGSPADHWTAPLDPPGG